MKKLFTSLFVGILVFNVSSQIDFGNVRQGESVEYCITHKKMNELKADPNFMKQFIADQKIMQDVEKQMKDNPSIKRVISKIPVVFHILHNGGVENITKAQILDAVAVLNRDFRMLNADTANIQIEFRGIKADIEVEFVLATKAPDGKCFSGITRTQSSESYSGNGSAQLSAIKNGNDVYKGEWAGDKYLNFFVCGDLGGAAGYTYKPSTWLGNAMGNGIFILHDYVGRIGTGRVGTDRALTHEVGHWLNLDHTWGGNNNPGNASSCSDDDAVSDTPNTIGVTACLLSEATCGPKANVENYMDYSYCSKMFTTGQKDRMIAALNSSVGGRNNIWKAANLVATGADGNLYLCAADFYSDRLEICAGDSIQFYDNSYNNVTNWSWTFTGAVNTASISQNPKVKYNTPGVYQVSLTAGDGSLSLTKTKTQYIIVHGPGLAMPFLDGFENYTTLASSNYWTVDNQQNNNTFEVTSSAAHTGSKSVKLANFGQTGINVDELIGNPVDLSPVTATNEITLSFRFSYRKKVTANAEKLFIYTTGNCGETWEVRKVLQGSALSSVVLSTAWTPTTQADWTTVHVANIGSQYWNENFRYKFSFNGDGGNNFYMDNINIYNAAPSDDLVDGSAGIVEKSVNENDFTIYPNPADKELNISYTVTNNATTKIRIVDVLGKTVLSRDIHSLSGNNLVVIGTEELAPGVYTALIQMDNTKITKQVVIK